MSDFLKDIFPDDESIPNAVRLPQFIEQREYLINGKLRIWKGDLNNVMSPVFVKKGGAYEQKAIGNTPLLTSKEALSAMDAAVAAYDLGHGVWPLMTVLPIISAGNNVVKVSFSG